jgi:hypothetical protein
MKLLNETLGVLAICVRALFILPLAIGLTLLMAYDESRARRNALRSGEGWED